MRLTFDKRQHLKSQNAIDTLFAEGQKFMAFPFRVVYRTTPRQADDEWPVQVLTVARKRLYRHAVDRNRVKRLLREAYRLHQMPLVEALNQKNLTLHIAFVSISPTPPTFESIEKQMIVAIEKLCSQLTIDN